MAWVLSCAPLLAQTQAEDSYLQALQQLRKTVIEQERNNREAATTNLPPASIPTFEELEKQYLDGKLSARQFQEFVLQYKLRRSTAAKTPEKTPTATESAPENPAGTNAVVATPTATTNTPSADSPAINRLVEMEARMDQIIKEKAERDKAKTNEPPKAAELKTKRERLNDLLRQLIAGKITEEEYKTNWANIAAEKE